MGRIATGLTNLTVAGMERRIREMEIWIVELNDRVVGWSANRGDRLEGLYINPQFVGRGIGTEAQRRQRHDLSPENLSRQDEHCVETVWRDYFSHLTVDKLVRKVGAGKSGSRSSAWRRAKRPLGLSINKSVNSPSCRDPGAR
jgi:hypothetical protein